MEVAGPVESLDCDGHAMPQISVIILAIRGEPLLRPAVDSILDQTMSDLELVLVDNGAPAGAVDGICAARRDPRIKRVRNPRNLGIAGGMRAAVPHCIAPWIALMDDDDVSHPLRLELQLRAAAADPSLDVIGTAVRNIDSEGGSLGTYPAFYDPDEIHRYASFGMPIAHPTLMGRAGVFQNVAYRGEFDLVADFDFFVRASERYRFGAVSLPLYLYRRHPDSTTVTRAAMSAGCSCVVRLCTARRRAGREEGSADLMEEALRMFETHATLGTVFSHYADRCHREGFPLLAALHAALAVRERGTPLTVARYLHFLLAAIRADRGSWRQALEGAGKGPFWILLKRAGFPAFPRY